MTNTPLENFPHAITDTHTHTQPPTPPDTHRGERLPLRQRIWPRTALTRPAGAAESRRAGYFTTGTLFCGGSAHFRAPTGANLRRSRRPCPRDGCSRRGCGRWPTPSHHPPPRTSPAETPTGSKCISRWGARSDTPEKRRAALLPPFAQNHETLTPPSRSGQFPSATLLFTLLLPGKPEPRPRRGPPRASPQPQPRRTLQSCWPWESSSKG